MAELMIHEAKNFQLKICVRTAKMTGGSQRWRRDYILAELAAGKDVFREAQKQLSCRGRSWWLPDLGQ